MTCRHPPLIQKWPDWVFGPKRCAIFRFFFNIQVSELSASFGIKKPIWPLLMGKQGVCMLFSRINVIIFNWDVRTICYIHLFLSTFYTLVWRMTFPKYKTKNVFLLMFYYSPRSIVPLHLCSSWIVSLIEYVPRVFSILLTLHIIV